MSGIVVSTAEEMVAIGRRLGRVLRAGDLVLLAGDLGAGKTTLTKGIGAGLGVRGAVTSPTFVIARVHPQPPGGSGPALVHVDAYRLGGWHELLDLDLEAGLDDSVTVVEWGAGLAEPLSGDRLEIRLTRSATPGDEARLLEAVGVGPRWAGVPADLLVGSVAEGPYGERS